MVAEHTNPAKEEALHDFPRYLGLAHPNADMSRLPDANTIVRMAYPSQRHTLEALWAHVFWSAPMSSGTTKARCTWGFLAQVSDMIEHDNACQAMAMQHKPESTMPSQSMATVGMSIIYESFSIQ